MRNWFNSLNEALDAEGLIELWPCGLNMGYSENARVARAGRFISVYRDERGMYERPIHYTTQAADFQTVISA